MDESDLVILVKWTRVLICFWFYKLEQGTCVVINHLTPAHSPIRVLRTSRKSILSKNYWQTSEPSLQKFHHCCSLGKVGKGVVATGRRKPFTNIPPWLTILQDQHCLSMKPEFASSGHRAGCTEGCAQGSLLKLQLGPDFHPGALLRWSKSANSLNRVHLEFLVYT